ncbi:MAG TPA: hypothetical protein VMB24_04790 [Dehalococcoidales bacterium]|nr:hypothetical protein [Dehalococcoidales bacterium]
MVGATLLALIVTGGVFARGFINSAATVGATISDSNFAEVSKSANFNNISYTEIGMTKGSIGRNAQPF